MKTVFVVDDSNVNLFLAKKALSKDYRVFTLPSAPAMFKLLENITPDLLLLDIKMPEMDGFEAMKLLRKDKRYTDIPVIFLTSEKDAATEAQGLQMGAVDYIHKPYSAPVLLNRIKVHLDINGFINKRTEMLQRIKRLQRMQNSKREVDRLAWGEPDDISMLISSYKGAAS